jgi:hypothetical protein
MEELEVNVIRTSEVTKLVDGRTPQQFILVEYKVGSHGPFYAEFPRIGFVPSQARLDLEQFARGLAQLVKG